MISEPITGKPLRKQLRVLIYDNYRFLLLQCPECTVECHNEKSDGDFDYFLCEYCKKQYLASHYEIETILSERVLR